MTACLFTGCFSGRFRGSNKTVWQLGSEKKKTNIHSKQHKVRQGMTQFNIFEQWHIICCQQFKTFHKRSMCCVWLLWCRYDCPCAGCRNWETTQSQIRLLLKAKRSTDMCQKGKVDIFYFWVDTSFCIFSANTLYQLISRLLKSTEPKIKQEPQVFVCIIAEGQLNSEQFISLKSSPDSPLFL